MIFSCPNCNARIFMERIGDLNVVEYQAYCPECKWKDTLRQFRCGGCHGNRLFVWTSESWRCIQCSHIRRNASPPRGYKRKIENNFATITYETHAQYNLGS